jgi:hypothetical protein
MDPHYWPSLYPAIGIGLLVGFAVGGWLPLLSGALGGLLGGVLGLMINGWLGLSDGFMALVVPVVCSALIARGVIFVAGALRTAIGGRRT